MVCLNDVLPFNKINLRNNISKYLQDMIKLEFQMELNKNIIEKITRNIQENMKQIFSNNHFLYLNIDDNYCTHMFKKGKKEGYFCIKKIKTNLPEGSKKDYLCCVHSRKHIPRKRLNIKSNNKIHEISKNSEKSEISKKFEKYKNISIFQDIHKLYNKNKIKKRKSKKIFIGNSGIINFSEIFNNILI